MVKRGKYEIRTTIEAEVEKQVEVLISNSKSRDVHKLKRAEKKRATPVQTEHPPVSTE